MSAEELTRNSSHGFRPIISGDRKHLPDGIGYAEVINAGKSRYNEDTASCFQGRLVKGQKTVKYTYIGLFDGHGGPVSSIENLLFIELMLSCKGNGQTANSSRK